MLFPRTPLMRPWLLPVLTRRTSRLPLFTTRGSSCLQASVTPDRKFSVSPQFPENHMERYTYAYSHEYPSLTVARTTRRDTGVRPGTDFSFLRVPPCFVPRGWSNEPRDLEMCLGLHLHEHYTSFPQTFSPILSYMGIAEWSGSLVSEGSSLDPDFYLITSDDQVYRLDTSIELLPLLVSMKKQANRIMGYKRTLGHGMQMLLEHPDLEWVPLEQDEWIERCTQATS